ncbi:beta-glucuronidase [soil metagenome]
MFRRFFLFLALSITAIAGAEQSIDLGGTGWTFRTTLDFAATPVSVPHCWMLDAGNERYIGHGIYEREFEAPPTRKGQVVRLRFDAVYDVAEVWLNGKRVGAHEGGYTAFEFDVTDLLRAGKNQLIVDVDNTPTLSSIPALATGVPSKGPQRTTIVGWVPYGGIVRPVHLVLSEAVYFRSVKVDAKPDFRTGVAAMTVRAVLHNGGETAASVSVRGKIAGLNVVIPQTRVPAHRDAAVTWTGKLPGAHLWSLRDPYLYGAQLDIAGDRFSARIGVRTVSVNGSELLLNEKPIHLYGANRVGEDPKEGPRESDAVIERDMSDMLADNMRMMRIAHYPQTQALLEFADAHGMLIIPEAGNWNFSAWQMADPIIRAKFKKQHQEMMEADWNHPSVIAWSMGNEYESYKQEGIAWTRDMRAFTLGLDPTRLITFASRHTSDPLVRTGKDEASQYSDFVSVNMYGDYASRLDHVHELWPTKPVFVTEFGKMGESGLHDPERTADITTAVEAMKARPWVIGGSLWTWNDYKSLIKGTPADGIRRWGVVNEKREHRDSWEAVRKLFATDLP